MPEFNLNEYKDKETNSKRKVFIEYLFLKYGISSDVDKFDNEYFACLNDDDLIQSLEYYISRNKVTGQITARNYITYIEQFFKTLSDEYGIRNEIFTNIDLKNEFVSKSNKIISTLKKTESKNSASDEQYEKLCSGIEDFLSKLNENDLYGEIGKIKNEIEDGNVRYGKLYYRFVSVLPIMLVMKFALSNLTLISLDIEDVDMKRKVLKVNGFELGLDERLTYLFSIYLKIRDYILEQYSIQESKLFIKHNGEPFIKKTIERKNKTEYAAFFKILKDIIGTHSADLFAGRRILEMLDKGIDISTVAKLSGKSTRKCIELQSNSLKNEDINQRLIQLFDADNTVNKKIIPKKRGHLTCPFCGKERPPICEDWILVQFDNDGPKYITCRNCGGKNGKYIV
jgi:hypothetical protein